MPKLQIQNVLTVCSSIVTVILNHDGFVLYGPMAAVGGPVIIQYNDGPFSFLKETDPSLART